MHLTALVVAAFASGFDGVADREPLHRAAYTGNIVQAHFALLRFPDAANAPCIIGKGRYPSPVHTAASRNRAGVLKLLIAHGGKVNDPGQAGWSPLQLAAMSHATEAAEVLLKHGATLDVFSAVSLGKWQEVQLWFRIARLVGHEKQLANASTPYYWGKQPILNWAIDGGHYRMVELLIHHGANVNPYPMPVKWPESPPLHHAMRAGRFDIAELLLRHGADIDAQDCDGDTALYCAVQYRHVDAARFLLKHGANPHTKKDYHAPRISDTHMDHWTLDTPLHTAARKGDPEMVALLLAHGACPNACNGYSQTPADVAAGLRPSCGNDEATIGLTPGRIRGEDEPSPAHVECLKLLYRYGGTHNPIDENG